MIVESMYNDDWVIKPEHVNLLEVPREPAPIYQLGEADPIAIQPGAFDWFSGADCRVLACLPGDEPETLGLVQSFELDYEVAEDRFSGSFIILVDCSLECVVKKFHERVVAIEATNEYGVHCVLFEPRQLRVSRVEAAMTVDDIVYEAKVHWTA